MTPSVSGSRGKRAVVIGAGFSGLCAARVLSDAFEQVYLIERDHLREDAEPRSGVPQGLHTHALLTRGRLELEALFPGLTDRILARGGVTLDLGRDVAMLIQETWMPSRATGLEALFASRPLIESCLRQILSERGGVRIIEKTEVRGLARTSGASVCVRGVRCGDGEIEADLVVDASGRHSRATEWFVQAGLRPPQETVVDSRAGYSTCWYEMSPTSARAGLPPPAVMIQPTLADPRSCVLIPVEGGRWIASIVGAEGRYPPADLPGFHEALRSLRSRRIADHLESARPLTRVYSNRATANRYRLYHRNAETVGGFIALGDAVCCPNPVYAQGMTLSALGAGVLRRSLRDHADPGPTFCRHFFRSLARQTRGAWELAVSADFRFPGTTGVRPPLLSLFNRYFDLLLAVSAGDAAVQQRLYRVMQMMVPPAGLVSPMTLGRVAVGGVRLWRSRAARRLPSARLERTDAAGSTHARPQEEPRDQD